MNLLAVFVGGGLGSLARYGIAVFVAARWGNRFPWATLGANVLSCVVFGLAMAWLAARPQLPDAYRLLLLVGFCGGFSTFSTFSFETFDLFRSGYVLIGLANILVSVCLCVFILLLFAKRFSP